MFIGNFLNFWTKYFYLCFTVKSHCYDNPCKNSGTCRDQLGNYSCECPPGFMGENCQGRIMVNLLFLIYLTWCQLIFFLWQLEENPNSPYVSRYLIFFSDRSLLRWAMQKQWILCQHWKCLPVYLSCSIHRTKLWRKKLECIYSSHWRKWSRLMPRMFNLLPANSL